MRTYEAVMRFDAAGIGDDGGTKGLCGLSGVSRGEQFEGAFAVGVGGSGLV